MKEIKIIGIIKEYNSIEELSKEDQLLIEASKKAVKNAYAPYSGFNVGAAVLLENGEIVSGNNQENAAYPSGLCAERVAVFAASAKYPDVAMKAIAITAESENFLVDMPVTPCGSCRQVLAEYEHKSGKDIKVILSGKTGKILILKNIKTLLPLIFDSSKLKKNIK
ncbi:MAG: cytidine deaminase [Bacteroidales bacterium]|nr:cytidine deaminase [Bacteroidales bacterium]